LVEGRVAVGAVLGRRCVIVDLYFVLVSKFPVVTADSLDLVIFAPWFVSEFKHPLSPEKCVHRSANNDSDRDNGLPSIQPLCPATTEEISKFEGKKTWVLELLLTAVLRQRMNWVCL